MGSTDLTKPEISVRILRCTLIYGEKCLGGESLRECLGSIGDLDLEYLSNESNWVSQEYLEDLLDAFVEATGDTLFAYYAGLYQSGPEVMPIGRSFLRALGSPRVMYEVMFGVGARISRVNCVGNFHIEDVSDGAMTVTYRPVLAEHQERNENLHHLRRGQIAALTRLFGLPSANADEHRILPDTAGSWYRFTWETGRQESTRPWGRNLGLGGVILGALLCVGLWFVGRFNPVVASYLIFSMGSIAYLLGRNIEESEHIALKDEQIIEVVRQKEDIQNSLLDQDVQLRDKVEILQDAHEDLETKNRELSIAQEALRGYANELEEKVKERTQEIELAMEQLKAADELKTRFFSSINHELRTPLTLILAPLEAILSKPTTLASAELTTLRTMQSNGLRLLKLINDMLDLSKFGAQRVRLRYEDILLGEVAREVTANVLPTADQAELSVDVSGGGLETPIYADREKIEQILFNLLSNAVKFTPRGGRISVDVTEGPGCVRLRVADTGVGIPQELQANIFDRFSVGGSQAIRGYGGTGLGLSIVKEIVDLHGGLIHLKSEEGAGTVFTVELPTGTEHVREDLRDRRRTAPQPTPGGRRVEDPDLEGRIHEPWITDRRAMEMNDLTDAPIGQMLPELPPNRPGLKTLLLVDDRVEMLVLLVSLLGGEYNILTATNGAIGLQVALDHRPDLVLSDVMMPEKDGYELCRDLKSDVRTEKIPVILLSAKEAGTLVKEGDALGDEASKGADDFLTKPFSARELKARISAQLRLRQMEADLRENNPRLNELATTDPLTGLLNRREFERRYLNAFRTAKESGRSLALVMFDIDFFRQVNNTYGHPAGDRVLADVAKDARAYIQVHGVAGRYGGEEFILFFPGWTQERAGEWAQGLRSYIEGQTYLPEHPQHRLTISVGVAAIPEQDSASAEDLVQVADEALYKAKHGGRNQVVLAA